MNAQVQTIECRSCGQARALDEFRVFQATPRLFMDFCTHCEQREGTITLYRRYNAYGTPEIIKAVYAAQRLSPEKRRPEHVRLLVEPKASNEPVSKESAVELELQRRELCRRRLMYFTTTFDPTYTPGWFHQDLARRLERFMERVERRESPRMIIAVPPRHGKSRETSDMFPSWILGHHPEWEIIEASYALELPIQFSRNVRDRLKDPEYQAIFENTRLRSDTQGVESWRTTKGGGYTAAGVGVGITGKGYNVGIIDDPIKDSEEANSEKIRENTWNWYQTVFRTRAAPGAGIIIIMTRWHFADLVGKALDAEAELRKAGVPDEELEGWEVVEYPAIAEHDEHLMSDGSIHRGSLENVVELKPLRLLRNKGDALHPERYSLTDLKKIRNASSSQNWTSLFQQKPTPDDGDFFKRADFRYRVLDEEYIKVARRFITADYAIKLNNRNNWTVLGAWALTHDDYLYLLDIRRGRWGTYTIADQAVDLVRKWKPEVYAGEQGQIHAAVWPVVEKELEKQRLLVSVDNTLVPMQDKAARASPLQARTQMGRLVFSYPQAARPAVMDDVEVEMLRFPKGVDDDIVDMMAWAARLAHNLYLPPPPTGSAPDRPPEGLEAKLAAALTAQSDDLSHMAA